MVVPLSNSMVCLTTWLLPLCILLILQTAFACNTPPPPTGSCQCGVKNSITSKIVGGRPADKHEYPWMVALVFKETLVFKRSKTPLCGGSLITVKHVLTAAHCIIGTRDAQRFQVVLYAHERLLETDSYRYDVLEIEDHKDYSRRQEYIYYDFSILTIDSSTSPVSLMPVCLPADTNTKYEGQWATATGWGATTSDKVGDPKVLMEVDLRVTSDRVCKAKFPLIRDSIQICAIAPGKDVCFGDSGGPLIVEENGKWTLVGVTSFGHPDFCALPGIPGVYAEVTGVMDWIRKHTSGTCTSARQSFS